MDQSNPGIRQFGQRILQDDSGIFYRQPGTLNQRSVIKNVAVCNETAASAVMRLCVAKAGDAPGGSNFIWVALPVDAGASIIFDWGNGGIAVEPGGAIFAWCSPAAALVLTISGIEYF